MPKIFIRGMLLILGLLFLILGIFIFRILYFQYKINKLNYCNQNSDCMDFSYNNGCSFASINSSRYEEALKLAKNVNGKLSCDYFSRKVEFTCVNNKCLANEISNVEISPTSLPCKEMGEYVCINHLRCPNYIEKCCKNLYAVIDSKTFAICSSPTELNKNKPRSLNNEQ